MFFGKSVAEMMENARKNPPLKFKLKNLSKKELKRRIRNQGKMIMDLRDEVYLLRKQIAENEVPKNDHDIHLRFQEMATQIEMWRDRCKDVQLTLDETREALSRRRQLYESLEKFCNAKASKSITEMASAIHNAWAKWYIHQKNNSTPENIERWNRQSASLYDELSEEEQQKDIKILMDIIS